MTGFGEQRPLTGLVLAGAATALWPSAAGAHDTWVLTHDQESAAEMAPAPEIFTAIGAENVSITVLAIAFVFAWIRIGRTDWPRRMQDRLGLPVIRFPAFQGYAALALRLGLAAMLLTAAFGLHPRLGYAPFESPVLFASDLEFRHIDGDWSWLIWWQVILGLGLALGAYVRVLAVLFAATVLFGFYLFTWPLLAYAGVLLGTAYYLLIRGGGRFQLPLPAISGAHGLVMRLQAVTPGHPQFVLRILTGLTFLYLGVLFKFLHPTFLMEGIRHYDLPLFGFEAETFVFIVATVETAVGILITAGVLIRPLTLVLVGALAFFTVAMDEGVLGHSFLYGVVAAFLINGAGQSGARRRRETG
ncbi:MAG: hypothetical protein P1U88_06515 [Thalassobaculaceae bacterium]|nr:hypothetical protein [Thalassobaculaceae bacterium]